MRSIVVTLITGCSGTAGSVLGSVITKVNINDNSITGIGTDSMFTL